MLVDAGESAAKQYNKHGTVSFKEIAKDVVTNQVAGKLTENVKVNASNTIKTTEKQFNRAERVAAGDATSGGRAATVNKLENKLTIQNGTNQAVNQAVSGAVSNTIQGAGNALQGNNKASPLLMNYNRPATDATYVKKPILLPLR